MPSSRELGRAGRRRCCARREAVLRRQQQAARPGPDERAPNTASSALQKGMEQLSELGRSTHARPKPC